MDQTFWKKIDMGRPPYLWNGSTPSVISNIALIRYSLRFSILTKYNLRSTDKYAIPQTKPYLYRFQRVQYMIVPTWPEPAPTTMVWWNSIRSSPTCNIVLETGKTTTAKHQQKITKTTITKQKHQAQAPLETGKRKTTTTTPIRLIETTTKNISFHNSGNENRFFASVFCVRSFFLISLVSGR